MFVQELPAPVALAAEAAGGRRRTCLLSLAMLRLRIFFVLCVAGTLRTPLSAAAGESSKPSESELILQSRRKGPASGSIEDREAWREANEPNMRLIWAATHGDAAECKAALEQGADPDVEEAVRPNDFVGLAQ